MARFTEQINDDLNLPRAIAVTWDLVKSHFSAATKKATLLQFDRVLRLRLVDWQPTQEVVPDAIMALVRQRQQARFEKRWKDADVLRERVKEAGNDIDDTAQGSRVRAQTSRSEN